MLTTEDKLRRKPDKLMPNIPNLKHLEQLKKVGSPANYFASMLFNTTLEEDLKKSRVKSIKQTEIKNMNLPSSTVTFGE